MKRILVIFGLGFFTVLMIMSCEKKAIDTPKRIRFDVIALIDSSNTKSDSKAKGNLTAEYLSSTKVLTYIITYSGVEIQKVNLNNEAEPGSKNDVIILTHQNQKYVSPLKGSVKLDAVAEDALFQNNLYINIVSAKFPEGEIRGQLVVRDKK